MEIMYKGLAVPKWVLIVWPKIPQNLSAQFVGPSPKVLNCNKKRLHWAFVVHNFTIAKFMLKIRIWMLNLRFKP